MTKPQLETLIDFWSFLNQSQKEIVPQRKSIDGYVDSQKFSTKFVYSRHGFDSGNNSNEIFKVLGRNFCQYFCEERHQSYGKGMLTGKESIDWRMKERLKTVSAALVLCLNIGVNPPDVVKVNPCAVLECWIDPFSLPASKALEQIGKNLQAQYESLSLRTKYKQYLDPSIEEVRKLCASQRRNAHDERILFHYNGHGVPKPTASGEIWFFNKNYTQYIPVSLYDLQGWLGSPCINVYDCNSAGSILINYNKFAKQIEEERSKMNGSENPIKPYLAGKNIQLAACGINETLPFKPDLPADLFTSCLTSPIEIAVRWFLIENPLNLDITLNMISKIPGRLQDRKTPLGELNWIFTAVTDTIAWTSFPKDLFKKLFRQDLMVAALFRNYLFAIRIMRANNCNPMSSPTLPNTDHHPMWNSWDLAIDNFLAQLPMLAKSSESEPYEYKHSTFFSEHLTAFELWLEHGFVTKKSPTQLPIVLQVLLSQVHRLRALVLLSRFLDLGPWAVNLALSIGVFPYVLKLLQSPVNELKPVLVFLWARIIALDPSCQMDLLKDNGFMFFVSALDPNSDISTSNLGEHRAMAAFVLAKFAKNSIQGQNCCLASKALEYLKEHIKDKDQLLRQWTALCIGTLWDGNETGRSKALRSGILMPVMELLNDVAPEVRAASLYALTRLLGRDRDSPDVENSEVEIAAAACMLVLDGSILVRDELVVFISQFLNYHDLNMALALKEYIENELGIEGKEIVSPNSVFPVVLKVIFILNNDPHPKIRSSSVKLLEHVMKVSLGLGTRTSFIDLFDQYLELESKADQLQQKQGIFPFGLQSSTDTLTRKLKQTSIDETSASNQDNQKETSIEVERDLDFLNLNSDEFFDWSNQYFLESQMRPMESQEPGSQQYNERLWRRTRNESILQEIHTSKDSLTSKNWGSFIRSFKCGVVIEKYIIHQFEDIIIACDANDTINVIDLNAETVVNTFHNGSMFKNIRITDMKMIDQDNVFILMTSSNDGSLRLFKNLNIDHDIELLSAWKVLPDLNKSVGSLVLEWQQVRGRIIAGGSSRSIKIWDATRETCILDIPARSRNSIQYLTSDQMYGDIFIGGFDNGHIRVYDIRVDTRDCMVVQYKEHDRHLVNLVMQQSGHRDLISASANGVIKFWDLRSNKSLATLTENQSILHDLDVHNIASIFAVSTDSRQINVYDTMELEQICTLKESSYNYYTGYRFSKAMLKFHPHKFYLTTANKGNDMISLYSTATI